MLGFKQQIEILENQSNTWLVTGATGFIGSHLVEFLLKINQKVVAVDNFLNSNGENLEDVKAQLNSEQLKLLSFYKVDINNLSNLAEVLNSVDYVLHQAALGSVPRSIENASATDFNNVHGFVNVIHAFKDLSVKKIVFASSSSVYGDNQDEIKTENRLGKQLSPYAVTKYANELYADTFAKHYKKSIRALRYFNVYGPRQKIDGPYAAVIPKWIDAALNDQPIVINGDGSTSRDFSYIKNIVQANVLAALETENTNPFDVYNVAVGDTLDLNALSKMIIELVKAKKGQCFTNVQHGPSRSGDIKNSRANIEKIKTQLGYNPEYKVRDGLVETVDWYFKNFKK